MLNKMSGEVVIAISPDIFQKWGSKWVGNGIFYLLDESLDAINLIPTALSILIESFMGGSGPMGSLWRRGVSLPAPWNPLHDAHQGAGKLTPLRHRKKDRMTFDRALRLHSHYRLPIDFRKLLIPAQRQRQVQVSQEICQHLAHTLLTSQCQTPHIGTPQ